MLRIIDCATEEGLIILTHAGMDIGIYDRNYCSVAHILHVIDEVHPEKFVLRPYGQLGTAGRRWNGIWQARRSGWIPLSPSVRSQKILPQKNPHTRK